MASGWCPDPEEISGSAQDFRDAVIAAGVLPTLATLLKSADVEVQEQALAAIASLAGGNRRTQMTPWQQAFCRLFCPS